MAEAGVLGGDLAPQIPAAAFLQIKLEGGNGGLAANGGVFDTAAVGDEHQVVLGQVNALFVAVAQSINAGGLLFAVGAVKGNVGHLDAVMELHAIAFQVLDHGQDHGFILVVAGKAQGGEIRQAADVVDEALKNSYEAYLKTEKERLSKDKKEWFMPDTRPAEMAVSAQVIREQAAKADVALVTLGRTSGEFLDRMVADFNLTKEEQNMLKAVSDAFHAAGKKVVVVLNIGGVIETASWKSAPDAILCAWQAGQEGGNSVADVLSGKASPSGKLTMTFPVKFEDAASSDNFPIDMRVSTDLMNKGGKKNDVKNVDYTNYEEDIYVGYRYFDTFGKQVSYPFGYGLSYTTFAYDKAAVKADNGVYTVSVEVKNTGKVAGKEVVQLYVSAPDVAANKPEKELKAFAKTKELKPGEAVVVTLKVNADDLASYDEAASAWVVTPGNYKFLVGASSRDIKATLEAEVAAATQKTNNILKLQEPMSLLKR